MNIHPNELRQPRHKPTEQNSADMHFCSEMGRGTGKLEGDDKKLDSITNN
jgi:hypothetical protein